MPFKVIKLTDLQTGNEYVKKGFHSLKTARRWIEKENLSPLLHEVQFYPRLQGGKDGKPKS